MSAEYWTTHNLASSLYQDSIGIVNTKLGETSLDNMGQQRLKPNNYISSNFIRKYDIPSVTNDISHLSVYNLDLSYQNGQYNGLSYELFKNDGTPLHLTYYHRVLLDHIDSSHSWFKKIDPDGSMNQENNLLKDMIPFKFSDSYADHHYFYEPLLYFHPYDSPESILTNASCYWVQHAENGLIQFMSSDGSLNNKLSGGPPRLSFIKYSGPYGIPNDILSSNADASFRNVDLSATLITGSQVYYPLIGDIPTFQDLITSGGGESVSELVVTGASGDSYTLYTPGDGENVNNFLKALGNLMAQQTSDLYSLNSPAIIGNINDFDSNGIYIGTNSIVSKQKIYKGSWWGIKLPYAIIPSNYLFVYKSVTEGIAVSDRFRAVRAFASNDNIEWDLLKDAIDLDETSSTVSNTGIPTTDLFRSGIIPTSELCIKYFLSSAEGGLPTTKAYKYFRIQCYRIVGNSGQGGNLTAKLNKFRIYGRRSSSNTGILNISKHGYLNVDTNALFNGNIDINGPLNIKCISGNETRTTRIETSIHDGSNIKCHIWPVNNIGSNYQLNNNSFFSINKWDRIDLITDTSYDSGWTPAAESDNSGINMKGNVSIYGNLEVMDNLSNQLIVNGDASFNQNVEISNQLIVNRDASFNQNVEISNQLIVNGNASFNQNVEISNQLIVNELTIENKTLDIDSSRYYTNIKSNNSVIVLDPSGNEEYSEASGNSLGEVRIKGNLVVDGSQTIIHSTDVYITSVYPTISVSGNVEISNQLIVGDSSDITRDSGDPSGVGIFSPYLEISGVAYSHVPRGIIVMWNGDYNNVPLGWAICDGSNNTPDLRAKFILGVNSDANYNVGQTGGADTVTLTTNHMPKHNHGITGGTHTHQAGTSPAGGQHSHDVNFQSGVESGHRHDTVGYNQYSYEQPTVSTDNGVYICITDGNQNKNVTRVSDRTKTSRALNDGQDTLHTHPIIGSTQQTDINHTHVVSVQSAGHSHSIAEAGGDQAHENMPPYYVLYYIMKL